MRVNHFVAIIRAQHVRTSLEPVKRRLIGLTSRPASAGFTLIEMVIVMTIIALIIGGVTASQTIVTNAKRQAQIAQINELDSAVSTFVEKYHSLPGDMPNGSDLSIQGSNGDGDGFVDTSTESSEVFVALENAELFSFPGLITPTYPASKIVETRVVILVSFVNATYPYNTWFYAVDDSASDPGGVTGLEASWFDEKLDDGEPYAGKTHVFYGVGDWTTGFLSSDEVEDFFIGNYDGDSNSIRCTTGNITDGTSADYDVSSTLETCALLTHIAGF